MTLREQRALRAAGKPVPETEFQRLQRIADGRCEPASEEEQAKADALKAAMNAVMASFGSREENELASEIMQNAPAALQEKLENMPIVAIVDHAQRHPGQFKPMKLNNVVRLAPDRTYHRGTSRTPRPAARSTRRTARTAASSPGPRQSGDDPSHVAPSRPWAALPHGPIAVAA